MSEEIWHATPNGLLAQGDTVAHAETGELGRVAGWQGTDKAVVVWNDGRDECVQLGLLRRQTPRPSSGSVRPGRSRR